MCVCSCRNGHVRKVFAKLYDDSGLVSSKRDIYEEYLSTPHHCLSTVAVKQSPSSSSQWRLYSVKELLTELHKKAERADVVFKSGNCLPSYREKLRTPQNSQFLWSYGIIQQTDIDPPIVREGILL